MNAKFSGEVIEYGDPVTAVKQANKLGILQVAITGANNAKDLSPFDNGQLRNGNMYAVPNPSGFGEKIGGLNDSSADEAAQRQIEVRVTEDTGYFGNAVIHGIYQELGTRYMAPQPYLRPAGALTAGQNRAEVLGKIQREQMLGTLRQTAPANRVKF